MPTIQVLRPGLFSGIPSGRWVAVLRDQKKVLGTGRTMDQALRKAEANPRKTRSSPAFLQRTWR
jgi:hypothetical protein